MTQFICLANSWKHNGRCIAGIDPATGQWVRPISRLEDGRIPLEDAHIDGQPIQLLDMVDIPLGPAGKGYGCENRFIVPGGRKRLHRVDVATLWPYCEPEMLYGDRQDWLQTIPASHLDSLPPQQRRTLQLLQVSGLQTWRNGFGKWKGAIPLTSGGTLVLNITDPALCGRLDGGYSVSPDCLVVLSLSQPWQKPNSDEEPQCYRLIAGVLEL